MKIENSLFKTDNVTFHRSWKQEKILMDTNLFIKHNMQMNIKSIKEINVSAIYIILYHKIYTSRLKIPEKHRR